METHLYTSNGKNVLLDPEDYIVFRRYKWHATKQNYVGTTVNGKKVYLHRLITNAPDDLQVDHINRNPLDNRRANLRLCSSHQNNFNAGVRKDNSSGYKGVDFHRGKWRARIKFNGKKMDIGYFGTPKEAALAYNESAAILFGEFAYKNPIGDETEAK